MSLFLNLWCACDFRSLFRALVFNMVLESQLSPIQSAVSPTSDADPIPELFDRLNTLNT